LAGCFVLMIVMGLLASSYGPLLPLIRTGFAVSAVETGLLVSALPAGATVAIIACARLQQQISTRLLLQAGAAFLLLGQALLALAPSWWLLVVGSLCVGVGYGASTTLANGVIAAAYPVRRGTFLLNLQNGLFGVGAVLGPICVAVLPDGSGRLAWLGYAGLAALAAALLNALPSNALASPGRVLAPGATEGPSSRAWSWRLAGFAVLFACLVAVEISTGAWATTHLDSVGASSTAVALATSLFYLGLAIGRLGAAAIGLRVDPGPLLVAATITGVAMLGLTYLTPLGGVAYVLVGMAIGPVFPTGLAWVSSDQAHAGHPIAVVLIAGNLGGMILPPIVGAVIGGIGAGAAPIPIAITCAAGAVIAVVLARGTDEAVDRPVEPGPIHRQSPTAC